MFPRTLAVLEDLKGTAMSMERVMVLKEKDQNNKKITVGEEAGNSFNPTRAICPHSTVYSTP